MTITLDPMVIRAYRPVALPDGNAVVVNPQQSSVLLNTFNPADPDTTLLSETLDYEQYAQMRADNPDIAYPQLTEPEDQPSQSGARVRQGRIKPNGYPQPGPIANTTGIILPKTSPAPPGAPSNPSGGAETEAEQGWWKSWGSSVVHITLDVVGLIPVVGEAADLANAAIYAAEGDYQNAAISAAAAIPFAGWAASGVKAGKHASNAISATRATTTTAEGAAKTVRQGKDGLSNTAARQPNTGASPGGHVQGKDSPNNTNNTNNTNSKDGQANSSCC